MNLQQGGHLSHGSPVNISGMYFNVVPYGVDGETGRIDYDKVYETALQVKPKMIVAGASAYPRAIDFAKFSEIAKAVGAYLMVDMAHIAGLVAAGVHQNPVEYADIVTTTTHKTLRGPRGGMILCREEYAKAIDKAIFPGTQGGPLMHTIAGKAVCFGEALKPEFKAYGKQIVANAAAMAEEFTGKELERRLDDVYITANKNTIPNEPLSPFVTSGVRLGTPAVTTRGLVEKDMKKIAEYITLAIRDFENSADAIRAGVTQLLEAYPLYQ